MPTLQACQPRLHCSTYVLPARRALAVLAAGSADSYAIWPKLSAAPQPTQQVAQPQPSAVAAPSTAPAPSCDAPFSDSQLQEQGAAAAADPPALVATMPAASQATTSKQRRCQAQRPNSRGSKAAPAAAALITTWQRAHSQPTRLSRSQAGGAATKAAVVRTKQAVAWRQQRRPLHQPCARM